MSQNIYLTVLFMGVYGLLGAHTIDIHLPSAGEIKMEEDIRKNKECDEAEDTINDPDSSDEERIDAWNTLIDNGRVV